MRLKFRILSVVTLTFMVFISFTCLEAVAGGGGKKKKKKDYTYTLINKTGYVTKITRADIRFNTGTKKMTCFGKVLYKGDRIKCTYRSKDDLKKVIFAVDVYRLQYPDQYYKTYQRNKKTWKITSDY